MMDRQVGRGDKDSAVLSSRCRETAVDEVTDGCRKRQTCGAERSSSMDWK